GFLDGADLFPFLLRQHPLKNISKAGGRGGQIAPGQRRCHGRRIRPGAKVRPVQPGKQLRCGQAEVRLAQYDGTVRQRRQVRQELTPSLCKTCAAPDAEGHIAAHCQPDLLQRLPRQIRGVQGPQAPQHRRHIRTAAPKPRISRDPLGKAYLQPRHRAAQPVEKGIRRPLLQSDLPRRKGDALCQQGKAARRLCHRHGVPQGHGLHHHPHVVIAVCTPPQNIQSQVDLGRGLQRQSLHRTTSRGPPPAVWVQYSTSLPK
ncbi:Phthiotriol/phenolphthiotriol dimycocerosates methyltransferase, partial [Dysosmobacter welbionis]